MAYGALLGPGTDVIPAGPLDAMAPTPPLGPTPGLAVCTGALPVTVLARLSVQVEDGLRGNRRGSSEAMLLVGDEALKLDDDILLTREWSRNAGVGVC